jgi:hypothetical protein
MQPYRIYFFGEGAIRGRHDFEASDHPAAIRIARALLDACSDRCEWFDLWQDDRRIPVEASYRGVPLEELPQAIQSSVVDIEERLRDSRWLVAQSRRLLDRIDHARYAAGARQSV